MSTSPFTVKKAAYGVTMLSIGMAEGMIKFATSLTDGMLGTRPGVKEVDDVFFTMLKSAAKRAFGQ